MAMKPVEAVVRLRRTLSMVMKEIDDINTSAFDGSLLPEQIMRVLDDTRYILVATNMDEEKLEGELEHAPD